MTAFNVLAGFQNLVSTDTYVVRSGCVVNVPVRTVILQRRVHFPNVILLMNCFAYSHISTSLRP